MFSRRQDNKKNVVIKADEKADFKIMEKVKKIETTKNVQQINWITKSLSNCNIFQDMDIDSLTNIVDNMFYCEIPNGEFVFKQNDVGSCFFLLEKGKLQVIINDQEKRCLNISEGFGDLALLYNAPRTASIKAVEQSFCWALDRITFSEHIKKITATNSLNNMKFVNSLQFTNDLTLPQKELVAQGLIQIPFKKGISIVKEQDPGHSLYIIMKGEVGVYKGQNRVRVLKEGESFGEQAMYMSQTRTMSCIAEVDSIMLTLGRDALQKILGSQIKDIFIKNNINWSFDKSPLFKLCSQYQKDILHQHIKSIDMKKDEVIFRKDQVCDRIIMILKSELVGMSDHATFLPSAVFFGDEHLESKYVFKDNYKLASDGVCCYISFTELKRQLGISSISDLEKQNKIRQEDMKVQETIKERVDFKKLMLITQLGEGQFGQVFLVQHEVSKKLYALKCIQKQQVKEMRIEKHIADEKKVTEMCNHPLIMNFVDTYVDEYNLYLLLHYVPGVELFQAIRDIGLLNVKQSRYFAASMIEQMEYLHSKKIVYRDLKPENAIVNGNGKLILIDLGTAKVLGQTEKTQKTFTIIGTPHYMAPEILVGKGYNHFCDLWSIGVCIFEFVCGGVPYGEDLDDPYEIHEAILRSRNLKFPHLEDKNTKQFIEMLLSKIPVNRLNGGYSNIKSMPIFAGFDWDDLVNSKSKGEYIPDLRSQIQKSEIDSKFSKKVSALDKIKSQMKAKGIHRVLQLDCDKIFLQQD